MILAIVGSTALGGPRSRSIILEAIRRHGATGIVSGGAKGIDRLAAQIGRELGLAVDERKPEVQRWEDREKPKGPDADGRTWTRTLKGFKTRNQEIADRCDRLVRISWEPADQARVTGKPPSYGSGWCRDRAAEQGKPTEEFMLTLEEDKT